MSKGKIIRSLGLILIAIAGGAIGGNLPQGLLKLGYASSISEPPKTNVIIAKQINLVDSQGRVRATLECSQDDTPGLFLFDRNGKTRLWLGLNYYPPSTNDGEPKIESSSNFSDKDKENLKKLAIMLKDSFQDKEYTGIKSYDISGDLEFEYGGIMPRELKLSFGGDEVTLSSFFLKFFQENKQINQYPPYREPVAPPWKK